MRFLFFGLIFSLLFINVVAQRELYIKREPKVEVTIFFNYHTENKTGKNEFEINRAYLGASNQFDSIWQATLLLDIGSPNEASSFSQQRRYAYFRKASIQGTWNNLTVYAGIVDMFTYRESEKFWGRRFIYKSMQDAFRFGVSADLGIATEYSIPELGSIDLAYVNGKGYNQLQNDNTFKLTTGITLRKIKPLVVRLYADIMRKTIATTTVNFYTSLKLSKFNIAGEIAARTNDQYKSNYHRFGYSIFSIYSITSKSDIFFRYDYRWSRKLPETNIPWDLRNDGSALIAGIEYRIHKNIRTAINYQDWVPYARNAADQHFLYLNLEVKF